MLSMTGYGENEAGTSFGTIKVEVKGCNNKYFTPTFKLPRQLNALEDRVRKLLAEYCSRGRIDIFVTVNGASELARPMRLMLDSVQQVIPQLQRVAENLGIDSSIRLTDLLHLPGLITEVDEPLETDRVWEELQPILNQALGHFRESRAREGISIRHDIQISIEFLLVQIDLIANDNISLIPFYREKLLLAAKRLAPTVSLDDYRLEQEAVLLAERCDITEEVNRIRNHLREFERLMAIDEPIGRRLDFIAQELIREITTIGAKTSSVVNSNRVIEFKSELDKVREQVQNVE